jgi:hypothetical protein
MEPRTYAPNPRVLRGLRGSTETTASN